MVRRRAAAAVAIGAIVKLAIAAWPISGTENIARQLSSDRLGGTRFGGNHPARGLTSDHRMPTISGTIRPSAARPKNRPAMSQGNERYENSQERVIGAPRPAPA